MSDSKINQITHYEKLRDDIRNEIKQRIKQRDSFSVQMLIGIGALLSVSFGIKDLINDKLLVLLPAVSIFYTGMILYSYDIHHTLSRYMREVIEIRLSSLLCIDADNEWEQYYSNHKNTPGIRHFIYKIFIIFITIFSSTYLLYCYRSDIIWKKIFLFSSSIYIILVILILARFKKERYQLKSNYIDWINPNRSRFTKAIFLDRDGTINVDKHYAYKPSDLEIPENSLDGMRMLSTTDYQLIIVTNQAGIALGKYKKRDMSKFNRLLVKKIHKEGGRIDAILFCAKLEEKDFTKPTQKLHFCMKPNPGLLIEASRLFNINLSQSIIIGDKLSDIEAGEAVGAYTILVKTGKAVEDENILERPNQIVDDLLDSAISIIKNKDTV